MKLGTVAGWVLGALSAFVLLAGLSVLAPSPVKPGGKGAADAAAQGAKPAAPKGAAAEETAAAEKAAAPAKAPAAAAKPAEPAKVAESAAPSAEKQTDTAKPAPAAEADKVTLAEPAVPAVATTPPAAPSAKAADTSQPSVQVAEAAPSAVPPPAVPAAPGADAAATADAAPKHDTLLEPKSAPAAAPEPASEPSKDVGAAPTAPAADNPAPADSAAPKPPVAPAPADAEATKPQATESLGDGAPPVLKPAGSLGNLAKGVKVGALPQIGKDGTPPLQSSAPGEASIAAAKTAAEPAPAPTGNTAGLPQIGVAQAEQTEPSATTKPVEAFARPFTPVDPTKPLFVILLRDIGAAGMSRDELAKLPFPVSIVLDPMAPDAGDAMKTWRAAGQEVVIEAKGLPTGATAGDVEQSLQVLTAAIPESVAVIDMDAAAFQNDRPLATLVVPVIQDGGRGLVTWDEGLDAADQIARRAAMPSARIFRHLDGAGESPEVIRRYLDRAAFKAAQDGVVLVLGDTKQDTVATILQWTLEGRASSVNLAPLTAAMARAK